MTLSMSSLGNLLFYSPSWYPHSTASDQEADFLVNEVQQRVHANFTHWSSQVPQHPEAAAFERTMGLSCQGSSIVPTRG
jgi:hypothetical protein